MQWEHDVLNYAMGTPGIPSHNAICYLEFLLSLALFAPFACKFSYLRELQSEIKVMNLLMTLLQFSSVLNMFILQK